MSRRRLLILAVGAALLVPPAGAFASGDKHATGLGQGDLVVTFSGSGGGAYRFHEAAVGAGSSCRAADSTYSETDSYHWRYRFVVSPTGGSSDTPSAAVAGGQLSSSEQLLQCGGVAAVTSSCTQTLEPPLPGNSADLAYPGVLVGLNARFVTVGAVGELIAATPQPICTGVGVLLANPVEAFAQLQASVAIPRAALESSGDVTRRFTIGGSGLYDGVALSGSCNSTGCNPKTCSTTAGVGGGGGGPTNACSFNETYSGTIEVRVVR